ncbi:hypothetical protein J3R83DRAFT_11116 [Lanmaoa asiatica]|nr:hypothetical protein J3R83DRAFT_11116 [Lanmaoa asiatica]
MSQQDHVCCGVVEEVRLRRREASKPQPWIVRKFAVGLTILIVGYSTYVYAGRFCRDMIVNSSSALGNQATGVDYYISRQCAPGRLLKQKLLLPIPSTHSRTSIGPQYTQTTTRPGYERNDRSSTLTSTDIRGTNYELMSPTANVFHPPTQEPARKYNPQSSLGSGKSKTVASQFSAAASSVAKLEQSSHSRASTRGLEEPRATDVFGAPESPHIPDSATLPTHANPYHSRSTLPPPKFSRSPTTTPVLLPEYRYCSRCQIVKPSRAHHCKACGTGSGNVSVHSTKKLFWKFFVNFLQWATMFCFWTLSTLLGLNVKPRTSAAPGLDPQHVVVIALFVAVVLKSYFPP